MTAQNMHPTNKDEFKRYTIEIYLVLSVLWLYRPILPTPQAASLAAQNICTN